MAAKKKAPARKKAPVKKTAPRKGTPIDTRGKALPARTRKPKVAAWSFSRYKEHANCPAKLSYKVHDRLKEPGSPAMDRGNELHKAAEDYVNGTTKRPPASWPKHWHSRLKILRDMIGKQKRVGGTETQWNFDHAWKQLPDNDPFNKQIWLRIKFDFWVYIEETRTLLIIDYKSGKVRPDEHQEQLDLYALAGLLRFHGKVDMVQTELWYIDQPEGPGDTMPGLYPADQLKKLMQTWVKKTKKLLNDTRFIATPNYLCGWCHFRASNGGPCRHG